MSKQWRILSIDGGGIRGLIPITTLMEIEKRCGKPIAELFDIIAGTSTGAILALALTKPGEDGRPKYSARQLRDIYERDAAQIFHHPACWWANLIRPKYISSSGIDKIMLHNFGDTRLKDAVADVLIPSYDIENHSPWVFRSRQARRSEEYDFSMCDVARAAAATPTMFKPVCLPSAGGHISLVDGGVFANNPSLLAYAEMHDIAARKHDDFLMVSLGTGEAMPSMKGRGNGSWGYVHWSVPMLELVSEGGSEAVHQQVRHLLPADDYYRFQVDLPDDLYYSLDNPAKKNMAGMIRAAEEYLSDPRTEQSISTLCQRLLSDYQAPTIQMSCADTSVDSMVASSGVALSVSGAPEYSSDLNPKDFKVVLCYVRDDIEVVRPLADALKQRGVTVAFEMLGAQPDETMRHLLTNSAEASLISFVILSPSLLKNSSACQSLEWLCSRAQGGRNFVMPVMHRLEARSGRAAWRHVRRQTSPADRVTSLANPVHETTANGIGPLADQLTNHLSFWPGPNHGLIGQNSCGIDCRP